MLTTPIATPTTFSPIIKRRKLLEENVKEVKNHIMLSEAKLVKVCGKL